MTLINWQINYLSLTGLQNLKKSALFKSYMSLPTAHNYVVKTMMENLVSLEKNFLEPKLLIETLIETDKLLNENIEVFGNKNFSEDLLDNEKENINLLIERISILEKASQGKVNWANQFSQYLQENITRK